MNNYPVAVMPEQSKNLSQLFEAAYDLNKDLVEEILDTGQLHVNSVHCLHPLYKEPKLNEHIFENFGRRVSGTLIGAILQKIDSPSMVKRITQMVKVNTAAKLF